MWLARDRDLGDVTYDRKNIGEYKANSIMPDLLAGETQLSGILTLAPAKETKPESARVSGDMLWSPHQ